MGYPVCLCNPNARELGTQSRPPPWVAGTYVLEPSPAAPRVLISRKLESEAGLGLKPRHSVWDAGIQSGILTAV